MRAAKTATAEGCASAGARASRRTARCLRRLVRPARRRSACLCRSPARSDEAGALYDLADQILRLAAERARLSGDRRQCTRLLPAHGVPPNQRYPGGDRRSPTTVPSPIAGGLQRSALIRHPYRSGLAERGRTVSGRPVARSRYPAIVAPAIVARRANVREISCPARSAARTFISDSPVRIAAGSFRRRQRG
jgi:hypothetical protein